jgi:hypothetical protein
MGCGGGLVAIQVSQVGSLLFSIFHFLLLVFYFVDLNSILNLITFIKFACLNSAGLHSKHLKDCCCVLAILIWY